MLTSVFERHDYLCFAFYIHTISDLQKNYKNSTKNGHPPSPWGLISSFILKTPPQHLVLHWVPCLTTYPSQELVFQFSIPFILKGTYLHQTWRTLLLYLVFLSWLSPKYRTQSNLRKEGFLLAYGSRWYSASWSGRQGDRNERQLVARHPQLKKKSRERWMLALCLLHPFYSVWDHNPRNGIARTQDGTFYFS